MNPSYLVRRAKELGWLSLLRIALYKWKILIYQIRVRLIPFPFLDSEPHFELISQKPVIVNPNFVIFLNKAFELHHPNVWLMAEDRTYWGLAPSYSYPIYSKKNCDIKFTWEINRHQFFPQLALLYKQTRERKYYEDLKKYFLGWIEANPIAKGLNWASSLEIAIRIIAWIISIALIKRELKQGTEVWQLIINSLYQQAHYLDNNLSPTYKPGNNHIIGECCALVTVALVFPDFDKSIRWRKKGLKVLSEQLKKQIYEDGVSYEQSTSYQRFDLDFLLFLIIVARQVSFELPSLILEKAESMLNYVMHLTQPVGRIPMIGDSDSGRGWKLTNNEEFWNFSTQLNLGTVLFNRQDFKYLQPKISDDALILLKNNKKKAFDAIKASAPRETSKIFPQAGIAILRNGWGDRSDYLFFKYGNSDPNYPKYDSHAHCDYLSFTLCIKGVPIIVDSGTYTYNGPKEWRDYFRLTSAHNTVKVNGYEQIEPLNIFAWKAIPKGELIESKLSDNCDMIFAHHNGFTRLASPLIHQRRVEYFKKESRFKITDTFLGSGDFDLEWKFHFHPDLDIEKKKDHIVFKKGSTSIGVLSGLVKFNGIEIRDGWYSELYNCKASTKDLSIKHNVTIASSWETSFEIYPI